MEIKPGFAFKSYFEQPAFGGEHVHGEQVDGELFAVCRVVSLFDVGLELAELM